MRRIHLTPAQGAVARIHYLDSNGGLFDYVVEYSLDRIGCGFRIVQIATIYEGQIRYMLSGEPFGVESFERGEPSATGHVRWDGSTIWRLEEGGQESVLSDTLSLLDMIRAAFMDALRIYLDRRPEHREDAGIDLPALAEGEVSPVPEAHP